LFVIQSYKQSTEVINRIVKTQKYNLAHTSSYHHSKSTQ